MRPTHHSSTGNNYHNGNGTGTGNGATNLRRKKKRMLSRKKRSLDPALVIDYKDPDLLRRFITERGKIIPRRISGATQEQQRKLTLAIKRARFLALLPCSISHESERGFAGEIQNTIQAFVSSSMRGRGPGGHHRGGPGGHPQDGAQGPRGRSDDNRNDFEDVEDEE